MIKLLHNMLIISSRDSAIHSMHVEVEAQVLSLWRSSLQISALTTLGVLLEKKTLDFAQENFSKSFPKS